MNSFGEYFKNLRDKIELFLKKAAIEIKIETSILSSIESREIVKKIEMLRVLVNILEVLEKGIGFVKELVISGLKELKYLKKGLMEKLYIIIICS